MTKYETELQGFRPGDEMQGLDFEARDQGYGFIPTAGHGYLVVPTGDKNYSKAAKIVSYGYKGQLAIYLEEDCEAGQFLKAIA